MAESITVFQYKSPDGIFGKNIGTGVLNLDSQTIRIEETTIEKIRNTSLNECILDANEIYLRPMLQCSGLSIIDKHTAEDFFSSLNNLETKSPNVDQISKFFNNGCFTNYQNGIIKIDSINAIDCFNITDDASFDPDIREYELIVGYFVRSDEKREYYLYYPSEDFKRSQEITKSLMKMDVEKINNIIQSI